MVKYISNKFPGRLADLEKKHQDLLKKSKPFEELIRVISGTVKNVYGQNIQNSYTTHNGVFGPGGHSSTAKTGQSSKLEIALENSDIEIVETLIFDGAPCVKSGEQIKAYVFAGEEAEKTIFSKNEKILLPRKFKKTENVLYLEIMRLNTVDIYNSVHYNSRDKKLLKSYKKFSEETQI